MFQMGGGAPKRPATQSAKPKATRKPALVAVTVKLEPKQKAKFEQLGGEDWLREQIDNAEPDSGEDS